MIPIVDGVALDEDEIAETFIRAAGPGGQNVNKVASAVQLRLDLRRSRSLPPAVAVRAEHLAGRRATQDGVLIITARRHRTQERNRADALARLVALLERAAVPPVRRRATRPTAASRERRLAGKAQRAAVKRQRVVPPVD
jgi:ribosome-associated protein